MSVKRRQKQAAKRARRATPEALRIVLAGEHMDVGPEERAELMRAAQPHLLPILAQRHGVPLDHVRADAITDKDIATGILPFSIQTRSARNYTFTVEIPETPENRAGLDGIFDAAGGTR